MPLPAPLLRNNPSVHKNTFGHMLVLAGSANTLGAGALTSLAALRTGAGLVTWGIPKSLNIAAQKKASNCVMTLPLPQTTSATISNSAYATIKNSFSKYNVIALGPGLSLNPSTQKFVLKIIETCPIPLVVDADALTIIAQNPAILNKTKTIKILTPHPGEMARLINSNTKEIEKDRVNTAMSFTKKYNCILILKGHHTIVASAKGDLYINKTGNAGMATAGSGDVLTGMISALLAQGLSGFDAAKLATYIHGKAGDLAAKDKTRLAMIASDIIDNIPKAIKSLGR